MRITRFATIAIITLYASVEAIKIEAQLPFGLKNALGIKHSAAPTIATHHASDEIYSVLPEYVEEAETLEASKPDARHHVVHKRGARSADAGTMTDGEKAAAAQKETPTEPEQETHHRRHHSHSNGEHHSHSSGEHSHHRHHHSRE